MQQGRKSHRARKRDRRTSRPVSGRTRVRINRQRVVWSYSLEDIHRTIQAAVSLVERGHYEVIPDFARHWRWLNNALVLEDQFPSQLTIDDLSGLWKRTKLVVNEFVRWLVREFLPGPERQRANLI